MSNPFGKLRIDHDDEEVNNVVEKKVESIPLFIQQDSKKKKKVRPEEKKKMEEEQSHEVEEGFSEVGKSKVKPLRTEEVVADSEFKKENRAYNKGFHTGPRMPQREGQRQFERHSGTGRGKGNTIRAARRNRARSGPPARRVPRRGTSP